jgi:putative addiction module CopG family antidote
MNINLEIPVEIQEFVRSAIDRGEFHTEAEVVGEALRLLQERRRRIEMLRQEILPAIERLDRGEGIELDDDNLHEFFEKIKARHNPDALAT